ncbi:MAG: hypothetical protein KUG81_02345, partial [Gammaproteobacteria bacterium]|nr:hypothetical protein [Gammaproteobacteria bacterium]
VRGSAAVIHIPRELVNMVRNTRSTKATNVPARKDGKARRQTGKRATSPDFRNTTPTTAENDAFLADKRRREAIRIKRERARREQDKAMIEMLSSLPEEDLLELGDTQDDELPDAPVASGFVFDAAPTAIRARDGGRVKRKEIWLHATINLNGVDTALQVGQVTTLPQLKEVMPTVADFIYLALRDAVKENTHANTVVETPLDIQVELVSGAAQHVLVNDDDLQDRARGSPTAGLHFHMCFCISYNLSRVDPQVRVSYADLRRAILELLEVDSGVHMNFRVVWTATEAKVIADYDKNGEKGQVNVSITKADDGEYRYEVYDQR